MLLQNQYKVKRLLGKGGEGSVLLAWDMHLNREVAIKKAVNDQMSGGADLKQERDILKRLHHQALPQVHDYFQEEACSYLVMDFIEGITLKEYITAHGFVSQTQAIAWGMELAEVLAYLHSLRPPVIYRDLKPQNIIKGKDGEIKVIDFGTAIVREDQGESKGCPAGSYGFAAPEQFAAGSVADERSDIYAWGAVMHYMISGINPAGLPCVRQPLREYGKDISKPLAALIGNCLQPEPGMRYQTMTQVYQELRQVQFRERQSRQQKRLCHHMVSMLFMLSAGILFLLAYRNMEIPIGLSRNRLVWRDDIVLPAEAMLMVLGSAMGLIIHIISKRKEKGSACHMNRHNKSIFLTDKQGSGLWCGLLLTGGILLGILLSSSGVTVSAAAENRLAVTLKNNLGQKILLKEGAVYEPAGNILFEILPDSLPAGEVLSIRIVVEGEKQNRMYSREFRMKQTE